jgi:hypothetical protein
MKKLLVFLTIAVSTVFVSCLDIEENKNYPAVKKYDVQIIDSCEYIISNWDRSRAITHKGNCKFCQMRNQKIVIDTVCTLSK